MKRRGHLFIEIDRITSCLEDEEGNPLNTIVYKVEDKRVLKGFNKLSGWYVNWGKLYNEYEIFALALEESPSLIQGLVAIKNISEAGVILLHWAVSAPHNNPLKCKKKKYYGVGGHLFAIALLESIKNEYGGVVIGHPSNKKLYEYYQDKLGAKPFNKAALSENYQYTIILEGMEARRLYEKYTFEEV